MSTCLVVQHVDPEGPYAIGAALVAAGVDVDLRRLQRGEPLPEKIVGYEGLVVMGGPMSAAGDEGFPSRRHEIELLAEAVDLGLPALGVCLGAQLLAVATGGAVRRGEAGPEIGWAPVRLEPEAAGDPVFAGVPTELPVLHWHGDTYDRPPGSARLAGNGRYREQAFRVGPRAWGLQFHVEVDRPAVEAFVAAFGHELESAGTSGASVLDATADGLERLAPHRDRVLSRFADLVAAADRPSEPGRA